MGVVHKGPPQGEGVWSNEDTSGQRVRTLRTTQAGTFLIIPDVLRALSMGDA